MPRLQHTLSIAIILECGDVTVVSNDLTAGIGEDVVHESLLGSVQRTVGDEQNGTLDGVGTIQDVLLGGSSAVELDGNQIFLVLVVNAVTGVADGIVILHDLGSQSAHGGRLDGLLGDGSALHDALLKDLSSAAGQVTDDNNDLLVLQGGIQLIPVSDLAGEDLADGLGVQILQNGAGGVVLVDGQGQSVIGNHVLGVACAQLFLLAVLDSTGQHTEVGSAVQNALGAVARYSSNSKCHRLLRER